MIRNLMASRRSLLIASLAAPFSDLYTTLSARAEVKPAITMGDALSAIENASGGRIGVSVFDTGSNRRLDYRSEERFPLCSTFKVVAVGAVLKRSMSDGDFLEQRVTFEKKDIVTYSPITTAHLANGMTVGELCAAALQYSDNTAGNLLIRAIGGLQAVTEFARSIGDKSFRLDRWEPDLNEALPNDNRDTTTPSAMQETLNKLAFGSVLGEQQRERLLGWMRGNTTGSARIRAGVPADWKVADKTGGGSYGTTNDIGIVWPSGRAPLIVAIYFTQLRQDAPMRNDLIATATRAVVTELSRKETISSSP